MQVLSTFSVENRYSMLTTYGNAVEMAKESNIICR